MKNYKGPGENVTRNAPYAVDAGDGLLVGQLFGVAVHDAANGKPVVMTTRGVFDLKKTSAQAWAVGALIYWDNANKVCTTVTDATTLIGSAEEAAANPSDTGVVRLNGVAVKAEAAA
jgi:predicted RecA/RadA family phage recombinase